jgi:D-serine dehydratase
LFAIAEVVIGWRLLEAARVAQVKLAAGATGDDVAFYQGKLACMRFFCKEVLPELAASRKIVEASTLEVMEMADDCF